MNDELGPAVAAVHASTTPHGGPVGAADLHAIARTRLHRPQSTIGDELRYRTALILALARDGQPEEATVSAEDLEIVRQWIEEHNAEGPP